ncbi:MAG: serine hydrolase [Acidobacteria bacterium]|nr:serine hydrolase [Acidobacteriota bacterium]
MITRRVGHLLVALSFSTLLVAGVGTSLIGAGAAADVPRGTPEEVGLSAERLTRINDVVQRAIDAEAISGAVTIVARHGKIAHFEAQGLMDIEGQTPMGTDTIFPIASMTKPVTGVAILMLVEEGLVRLNDPVSRFVPEFADPEIAVWQGGTPPRRGDDAPEPYTIPAAREVTISDLMTHTSGLGSGGAGASATQRVAPRRSTDTLETYVAELGDAPLDFHPGTHWAYSGLNGIDTLGRVVEVVSGLTFDQFLEQRIFDPLGMEDTAFVPATESGSRVVTLYRRSPDGLDRIDVPAWVDTTTLFSGGGGLWSTAKDYLQFAQMLLNRGELGGVRLLGTRTVELMASNHVGDLFASAGTTGGRPGMGFGLTVQVVDNAVQAQQSMSDGSFGWGGAFGTNFWVDPVEDLTAVLMVQTPGGTLRNDFANAVRQAIVD